MSTALITMITSDMKVEARDLNVEKDRFQLPGPSAVKTERIDTEDNELDYNIHRDNYSANLAPEFVEINITNIKVEPGRESTAPESDTYAVNMHIDKCIKAENDVLPASQIDNMQAKENELDLKIHRDHHSGNSAQESVEISISNIKVEHSMGSTAPQGDMSAVNMHIDRFVIVEYDVLPASKIYNTQASAPVSKKMKLAQLEENPHSICLSKRDTEVRFQENINIIKKLNSLDKPIKELPETIHMDASCGKEFVKKSRKKYIGSKNNLARHKQIDVKLFKCHICEKSFHQKGALITHIRVHTGEKPFKCNTCEKFFYTKRDLTVHIRLHTGEKQFKCNLCEKSFYKKSDLTIHSRIHTGEKPFKCDICQKSFIQKGTLNTHIRIHTGEKPFKCHLCEKSFNQKGPLNTHIRAHTGDKPYKCNTCEKFFYTKSDLTTHLRLHTGEKQFKCNICEKDFYNKSDLTVHIRIHTGEKPFKCHVCEKSFNQKGTLNTHIRIHTGEKPFKCHLCEKSFNQKGPLKIHIRVHTEEK